SNAGDGGGGGAGGLVVIRTQGTLSGLTTVSVAGGPHAGNGGNGANGRVRLDAAMFSQSITTTDSGSGTYYGPMPLALPLVSHDPFPMISAVGQGFASADGHVINQNTNVPVRNFAVSFGTTTPSTVMSSIGPVPLTSGYNLVCFSVPGGDLEHQEVSSNC